MSRLLRVIPILILLSSPLAYALTRIMWFSAGESFNCTSTSMPRLFRCVGTTSGTVIYVTGDTEAGCGGAGSECVEVLFRRSAEDRCYKEYVSAPEEHSYEQKMVVVSDKKELEVEPFTLCDLDEGELEPEPEALPEPAPELIEIPCDDGLFEPPPIEGELDDEAASSESF